MPALPEKSALLRYGLYGYHDVSIHVVALCGLMTASMGYIDTDSSCIVLDFEGETLQGSDWSNQPALPLPPPKSIPRLKQSTALEQEALDILERELIGYDLIMRMRMIEGNHPRIRGMLDARILPGVSIGSFNSD